MATRHEPEEAWAHRLTSVYTYLKVPPRLRIVQPPEPVRDAHELAHRHLGQPTVVHDGAAPRLLVVQDVAARSLGVVLAVDAAAQAHGRVRAKGRQHLCGGRGLAGGERAD